MPTSDFIIVTERAVVDAAKHEYRHIGQRVVRLDNIGSVAPRDDGSCIYPRETNAEHRGDDVVVVISRGIHTIETPEEIFARIREAEGFTVSTDEPPKVVCTNADRTEHNDDGTTTFVFNIPPDPFDKYLPSGWKVKSRITFFHPTSDMPEHSISITNGESSFTGSGPTDIEGCAEALRKLRESQADAATKEEA